MDGYADFTFGAGDDVVGKKSKRFKADGGRTYRASFVWFTEYDDDGLPTENAQIKFTGCETIYNPKCGYVLIDNTNRTAMLDLLKKQPKQRIATVIVVWPTDKDGDLDAASIKAGKGWTVHPWVFDPGKYQNIGKIHKRFPLTNHDLSMSCPPDGAQFQKLNFTPEGDSILRKYLASSNEALREVAAKILKEARQITEGIQRDLARPMTVDEVREGLGEDVASPTGNHAAADVDDLLDGVL